MEVAHASLALYSHSQQWQRHVQAKQSELKFWLDYVHSLEQQQQQGLAMSRQDDSWNSEQYRRSARKSVSVLFPLPEGDTEAPKMALWQEVVMVWKAEHWPFQCSFGLIR